MSENGEKVSQEQIHELLFKDTLSWQAIIYDLINTEQLDPWNIDISLLSQKYLEKVRALEEANFFVSSKVLLAASLLLRIKSEILLNEDLPALDGILFGKKEEKHYEQERIELDEDIPGLIPKTPLPRFRRVSLEELMSALDSAIKTETRRIKRAILVRQQEFETGIALPKQTTNLKEHIETIYKKLKDVFAERDTKLAFTELIEGAYEDRHRRIVAFVSLLHLDNQNRIWLEQEHHFDEIWIWLKSLYEEKNKEFLEALAKDVDLHLAQEKQKEVIDEKLDSEGEPIEDESSRFEVKSGKEEQEEESL